MSSKKSAYLQEFGIFDLVKLKKEGPQINFFAQDIIHLVYKYIIQ
jgi:hypothetical protein